MAALHSMLGGFSLVEGECNQITGIILYFHLGVVLSGAMYGAGW